MRLHRLFERLEKARATHKELIGVDALKGLNQLLTGFGVHLLNHALFAHFSEALGARLETQPQRALDGDAPVAEGVIPKDLAGRRLLKTPVEAHDLVDLLVGDIVAFAA